MLEVAYARLFRQLQESVAASRLGARSISCRLCSPLGIDANAQNPDPWLSEVAAGQARRAPAAVAFAAHPKAPSRNRRRRNPMPFVPALQSERKERGVGTAEEGLSDQVSSAPNAVRSGSKAKARAAQGPIPEPVSVVENAVILPTARSQLAGRGRRIFSTAFVTIGPDRHVTVELRDGRAMVLRNVVMRPKDYRGVQVLGDSAGVRHCVQYADDAAARPGGAPGPVEPTLSVGIPARTPSSIDKRN